MVKAKKALPDCRSNTKKIWSHAVRSALNLSGGARSTGGDRLVDTTAMFCPMVQLKDFSSD